MSDTWIVPKESLEIVVDLLDNVPTRNGIKSSEFIKVSSSGKDGAVFFLTSTLSGKAIIRTGEEFPFGKDIYLDRRLFVPFVNGGKELKATDYVFYSKKNRLIIRHGNRKAVYSDSLPIDGYEEPSDLESAHALKINKKWTSIVDCAANCATDDPITPSLNCVYVMQSGKFLEIMSTNGRLVFFGKVETDAKPLKANIAYPLGLVDVLKHDSAIKLMWTNKIAVVVFPKGRLWQSVKVAARKRFPQKDVREVLAKATKPEAIATISSSMLAKAVDRLSKYTSALDSADLSLEIEFIKGKKQVLLRSGVADSKFTELVYARTEAIASKVMDLPLVQVAPTILFAADEGSINFVISKIGSCLTTKNLTLVVGNRSKE